MALALEAEDGCATDRERSIFLSRAPSAPTLVRSFRLALVGRTPGPENHSPDLVRISCCLRQRLHTHMTCRDREADVRGKGDSDLQS